MIRTLLLAIFVVSVSCLTDEEWESYKKQHSKVYTSPSEATSRRQIFEANVERINQHNLEHKQGIHSYTMGINQFTDMTEEEIHEMYSMKLPPKDGPPALERFIPNCGSIPASINWFEKGSVAPVKNQGTCNSCWAFVVTGCLESRYKIAKNPLGVVVPLSEQQLVNCAKGNKVAPRDKCEKGWWPVWGMRYIIRTKGMISEARKPYSSENGNIEVCNEAEYPPTAKADATMSSSSCVEIGNDDALRCALTQGPVTATFPLESSFQSYNGGIYNPPDCPKHKNDHAVLIVGYEWDATQKKGLWIAKNSWGTRWGEQGYARINAEETNMCGISSTACFPII